MRAVHQAVRCLHLGRLPSQPGYLGFVPETGKLVESVRALDMSNDDDNNDNTSISNYDNQD